MQVLRDLLGRQGQDERLAPPAAPPPDAPPGHRHRADGNAGAGGDGEDAPGSRILSSLYLAITAFSLYALTDPHRLYSVCLFLFPFQIVYKSLSALTVRDMRNPVVLSNLLIVVIHSISLCWLLKHGA